MLTAYWIGVKVTNIISLDGEWQFKAHEDIASVELNEEMSDEITVTSCVQMHGYDRIQYINVRYPFPVDPPYIRVKNPTFHYRRTFDIKDISQKYYLNFEGVDSFFYVYVNGKEVGYSQISHATSEFDVTPLARFTSIIFSERSTTALPVLWLTRLTMRLWPLTIR